MSQSNNANKLTALLAAYGLGKKASEQSTVITDPVAGQTNLGAEQTADAKAATPIATNVSEGKNLENMPPQRPDAVPAGATDTPPAIGEVNMKVVENTKTAGQQKLASLRQMLAKKAEETPVNAANAGTIPQAGAGGTLTEDTARPVGDVEEDLPLGNAESTMDVPKAAKLLTGLYKAAAVSREAKQELRGISKQAAAQAEPLRYPTAVQCITKLASIRTEQDSNEFLAMMGALQSNPAFQRSLTKVAMRKKAEDIQAVVDEQGVAPEEAAAMLDGAVAADPALQEQLTEELNGEALQDLGDAEIDGAALEQAASEVGVAPEEIQAVAEQIEAIAQEMGVPPEAVAEQIAMELDGALGGGSPEGAPAEAPVEPPAEAPATAEEGMEPKTASQIAIARIRDMRKNVARR